jgi:hypothetical protein
LYGTDTFGGMFFCNMLPTFHVKIQPFATLKTDQDPDPHGSALVTRYVDLEFYVNADPVPDQNSVSGSVLDPVPDPGFL